MPDPIAVLIDPEVCTVPEGALTAKDVLHTAVLEADLSGVSRPVALWAVMFALDVTLPVERDGVRYCGVIPGETRSVVGDRRRVIHNHLATQRLMERLTVSGGGRVRVPDPAPLRGDGVPCEPRRAPTRSGRAPPRRGCVPPRSDCVPPRRGCVPPENVCVPPR